MTSCMTQKPAADAIVAATTVLMSSTPSTAVAERTTPVRRPVPRVVAARDEAVAAIAIAATYAPPSCSCSPKSPCTATS